MIKNTTRFDQSKKLMDNVKSKYQNKYITTAGHSLGGSLAESVGGDKVVTVNKGAGIDNLLKKRKSNQTDIRAGGDLVSALSTAQSGGRMITVKNTNYINPLVSHDSNVIKNLNKRI
jgi:D-alanyl-D-alanine carboxypeptidase